MTAYTPDAKTQRVLDALKQGSMVTVEFTKRDGTTRKMTCRHGVFKYVPDFAAGKISRDEAKQKLQQRWDEDIPRGIVTVFDMNAPRDGGGKGDYRRINLPGLKSAKIGQEVITF